MKQTFAAAALLALALGACQQSDPNNFAIDEGTSTNADVEILPPDETATNEARPSSNTAVPPPPADSGAPLVPATYHGRWGMVPADCTSTRGDAKGLIAIGENSIRFYEAVATLKERRPAIATSFSGLFSFTGEGQTWGKVMTFTRTGDTLKRAEESGSFTYRRCA